MRKTEIKSAVVGGKKEAQNSRINTPRGGTSYNGLYGEAPPERGTFFRLQVYKRVGISQVQVYERVGISSFGYKKGP